MLDDKLKQIREEEDLRIKLGKKYTLAFAIINAVITLLSWVLSIYNLPIVIVSLLLSLSLFYISFTKFIWLVNSLYRSYWYLAIIFAMMNDEFSLALLVISLFIVVFDIYSSIVLIFSKSVESTSFDKSKSCSAIYAVIEAIVSNIFFKSSSLSSVGSSPPPLPPVLLV